MTEWATKWTSAQGVPPDTVEAPPGNPSFNILVGVIEDTIRESLGNPGLYEQESVPWGDVLGNQERIMAAILSLSEGISQQLVMMVRRIDDLERILEQGNEMQVTNLMQDAPDVYERIMDDEGQIAEEGTNGQFQDYESYLADEIKWTDFVKAAGGVANAVAIRERYESAHPESE